MLGIGQKHGPLVAMLLLLFNPLSHISIRQRPGSSLFFSVFVCVDPLISVVDRHGTRPSYHLLVFYFIFACFAAQYDSSQEPICLPRVDRDQQHVRLHPSVGVCFISHE
jgi:hypothetical protein